MYNIIIRVTRKSTTGHDDKTVMSYHGMIYITEDRTEEEKTVFKWSGRLDTVRYHRLLKCKRLADTYVANHSQRHRYQTIEQEEYCDHTIYGDLP